MSSYDASVALDRKLTAEETRELKISLMPYFVATGDTEASPEDINDLLDYAFAMVNNQKTVEYVIQELVGMEMEFCNATVAEKVGSELTAFLKKIMGVEEPAPKIASLKVCVVMSSLCIFLFLNREFCRNLKANLAICFSLPMLCSRLRKKEML